MRKSFTAKTHTNFLTTDQFYVIFSVQIKGILAKPLKNFGTVHQFLRDL